MLGDNFEAQCRLGCLGIGVFSGLAGLYLIWGQTSFLAALMVAIALAVFMTLVLRQLFCWPEDEEVEAVESASGAGQVAPASPVANPPKPSAPGAGVPAAGGTATGGPTGSADVAEKPAPAPAKAPAAPKAPAKSSDAAVKSGTLLEGEQELAARKGEWKYAADGDVPSGAAPAQTADTPDYDKDGVHEGANEGTKPAGMDGPRGGKADNLKEIKGVGPKLEGLLHDMGFYHFDQIANWSTDEVAWVDANLQGFKGRVSRDNWIDQAKILAAGGETEFSKRVDEGDVY